MRTKPNRPGLFGLLCGKGGGERLSVAISATDGAKPSTASKLSSACKRERAVQATDRPTMRASLRARYVRVQSSVQELVLNPLRSQGGVVYVLEEETE